MATKKTAAKAVRPDYPENLGITGVLSFPRLTENHLLLLKDWRAKKGMSKPKYDERIGGTLFINQKMVDKAQAYLLETILPYGVELNQFDESKGFDQDVADALREKIENEDWNSSGDLLVPMRDLSEKDLENAPEGAVAKFAFDGSGGNPISVKALVRDEDGALVVTSLDDVEGVPRDIENTLFWGARNTFRGAFNLNPYERAKAGISAYTRVLYLRTDLPMVWGGGDDTETILEEDFE